MEENDRNNLLIKSKFKYFLYDEPFQLIVTESDDISAIKNYLRGLIEDFGEGSVDDMWFMSEEYGTIRGQQILKFLGVE